MARKSEERKREIQQMIQKGYLTADYTREELSQLCNEMKYDIFWGCITGGVW